VIDVSSFFVSDGISRGRTWATYRRRKSGSLQRVVSPALPLRGTREEAEQDLRKWLERRLGVVCAPGACVSCDAIREIAAGRTQTEDPNGQSQS
jgi:hypothetical protein